MLDGSNRGSLTADLWADAELKARLPRHYGDFFECRGPTPRHWDSRRAFHRFYLRQKGIVRRQGAVLGVFTKDLSRIGIGILSPIQLLPKERIHLRLAGQREYLLEIARCRRIEVGCYECGTKFVLSS